eukprot:10517229-Alexandrium_andersonii.AAC.1
MAEAVPGGLSQSTPPAVAGAGAAPAPLVEAAAEGAAQSADAAAESESVALIRATAARLAAGAPPDDPLLARAGASATAPVRGGAGANPAAQACAQHKECTESR